MVAACDRIVGPDPADLDTTGQTAAPEPGRCPMTFDNALGLLVAVLIAAYLVAALDRPGEVLT